jgi:hypothetical protein
MLKDGHLRMLNIISLLTAEAIFFQNYQNCNVFLFFLVSQKDKISQKKALIN